MSKNDADMTPLDLDALRGHTPGPWEVRDDDRWGPGVYAAKNPHGADLDFAIVSVGSVNGDHRGERATGGSPEANARLIAAAPELLAELTARRARDAEVGALVEAASTLKVYGDGRGYFESGDDCNRFRVALLPFQRSDDKGDAT